ncbi:E3 ubiquitin-protein ligase RING2-A [Phytophthora citrophthora]|uniref:RING-type E3 ubiquitin transferase n=1 Tax=Phytophthora citrophthora TaxID=4793 RepID=A0AAD9FZ60_9STRA|nr:E3 ubiquitin-protein ligase RING2-A [Phytophthora citrophthora]
MAEQDPPRSKYTFTREEYDELVEKTPNCVMSKRSKYEEVELVDDCTLFDIYRQPRAPVTDPNATKTLPVRQLNDNLTCPICLGIIKEAMVVMECLHRFCGECITTAIRQTPADGGKSKSECPSCRIHIPSKRSLRPDTNFDALIKKIHPNLAEFERHEEQIIEQLNRSKHFNNAYTESARKGALSQAAVRRNGRKKPEGASSVSSSRSSSPGRGASPPLGEKRSLSGNTSPSDNSMASTAEEPARKKPKVATKDSASKKKKGVINDRVNFRVILHGEVKPGAPKLERTLFTTSARLKICHLKKHLAALLKLDSYDNMCVVLPTVNCSLSGLTAKAKTTSGVAIRQDLKCDQELEDFVKLQDIYDQYGMGTAWELRLLYHFSPGTIVNGIAHFVKNSA